MIKKTISLLLVAILGFLVSGCGARVTQADRITDTKIDLGESEIFS